VADTTIIMQNKTEPFDAPNVSNLPLPRSTTRAPTRRPFARASRFCSLTQRTCRVERTVSSGSTTASATVFLLARDRS
jgi:hypothetical protein